MKITLELSPKIEAQLQEIAKGKGLSLGEYASILLEDLFHALTMEAAQKGVPVEELMGALVNDVSKTLASSKTEVMPQERAKAFRTWAESHNRFAPLLSDEAISRESIYGESG